VCVCACACACACAFGKVQRNGPSARAITNRVLTRDFGTQKDGRDGADVDGAALCRRGGLGAARALAPALWDLPCACVVAQGTATDTYIRGSGPDARGMSPHAQLTDAVDAAGAQVKEGSVCVLEAPDDPAAPL
jgi:hypothetical protein